ncbi:MAG: DUF6531 domain-containing protein [Pseudomonadota bacterium]|nr:DUF6531 domain-containing protein [Pseudomonadota bacterium]
MSNHLGVRFLVVNLALWLFLSTDGAQAQIPLPGSTCDPTKSSCFPIGNPPPAGPGTCSPGTGGATCTIAGPATQGSGTGIDVGAGNPINVMTGNKYQREVDMPALPGVLGLEIVRHYNSVFSGPRSSNGIVGRGWKLSYETDLYPGKRTVQIVQADGKRIIFDRDVADPSLCTSSNPGDGAIRVIKTSRGDEYTWTWTSGRALSFNSLGKLVQIADPDGHFVSMQHDHRGMLLSVTDPQGRKLRLHYLDAARGQAGDRFRGVQSIDSPVGRFTFEYGSVLPKGSTLGKEFLMANLVKVSAPSDANGDATSAGAASSRLYHFENALYATRLTGISIESRGSDGKLFRRRIATYGYDADGKANLTVKGEPARLQTGPDGSPLKPAVLMPGTGIAQVTLDRSVAGRTVISNSLGQETTYLYTIIAGQYRLLEVRGAGCAGCGEPNMRYAYNALGQLIQTTKLSMTGAPIFSTKSELDKLGRTVSVSKIVYQNGKPGAAQMQSRFEYIGDKFAPAVIARPSVVPGKEALTRIDYNAAGQAVSVTESGWAPVIEGAPGAVQISRTTKFRYAVLGGKSVLSEIDGPLPNGKTSSPLDSDITVIEYDKQRDNAAEPRNAPNRGGLALYTRRDGLVTRIVAPGGRATDILERDGAGRVTRIIAPGGLQLGYEFDTRGHLIRRSVAGVNEFLTYDALGQLASARHSTGQTVNLAYGADGRVSDIFDAQNNRVRISRDTEGDMLARYLLNPDGSVAQQADLSRPAADPDAPPRSELADPSRAASEPVSGDNLPETLFDPNNNAIRLIHDKIRRLSRFVDARGSSNAFIHDDFGRLVRADSPDTGTTIFRHDAADHLVSKITGYGTAQAITIRYRYDPAGRVIEQIAPEGITTVRYGMSGRPATIRFPGGEEHYSYDSAMRLLTHARVIDGRRFTTAYEYDERGQLKQKTLPDGQVLLYRYHSAMHPKAGLLAGISRQDLIGRTVLLEGLNDADDGYARQRYQLANGLAFVRELDLGGHIRRIGSPGVWEESHRRDTAGQLVLREPVGATAIRASYAYDLFGRMAGHAGTGKPADPRGYAYDAGGNLLAQLTDKMLTRYRIGATGNQILEAQTAGRSVPYSYNAAGSVSQIGDTSYRWDSQQRLVAVARAGKPIAEYAYNPFGERIKKISYANNQKSVTYFFYDGQQLVAEAEPDAGAITVTRQYVWLDDTGGSRPIALLQARAHASESLVGKALGAVPTSLTRAAAQAHRTDVFAIVADHTGAPRALVDEGKRTVWRAEVSGFGEAVIHADSNVMLNLRGSNQYFDEETQLHYNYRRYLLPASGRYLSADPSGLAGGGNPYVFADNNPVNRLDPLGLQSKPAGAVSTWTFAERLKYVIERVADKYPGELGDALKEMVSPASLATTAAIFGIWAGGHVAGYGWAADVAIAGIGYLFVGKAVWDVISGIYDSSSLVINAKCEKDLQDAGDILAKGFGSAVAAASVGTAGIGAPKVAKLVKLIFKDSAVAQKAATAAAITESWFGKFTPGKTRSGAVANAENLARHPGAYPPWSAKEVIDTWLNPGTKIYMVNLKDATSPGGWATAKRYTNLADARKELALLEEFKAPGSNCCVLQEYTVKAPIPVREGQAGPLTSKKPPYDSYPGGAQQWELMLDRSLNWRDFLVPTPNPEIL